jgi:hypothetical protein
MARGWESKSVESQQFEAPDGARWRERPSAEELERAGKRESLELSRRRVVNELAGARSEVHRTALQNALRHLEDELSKM